MEKIRVYKFYSRKWALIALRNKRLKISQVSELNDPFEFISINLQDPAYRLAFQNWKSKLFADKGLICFSKKWSNPVLWSHYADSHRGIALGFDVNVKDVRQVSYVPKRLSLNRYIEDNDVYDSDIIWKLLLTKFSHWRYENEVRSFIRLQERDEKTQRYFAPFGKTLMLKEVILGINYEPQGKNAELAARLRKQGIDIVTARPAFGSFNIVRQRKNSLTKNL